MASKILKSLFTQLDYPELFRAQIMKKTKLGEQINLTTCATLLTDSNVEKIRTDRSTSEDIKLIASYPFCDINRLTDHLFLTGMIGLTENNLKMLDISLVVNVTNELPLIKGNPDYFSVRLPVDDDGREEISIYFDEICKLIHEAAKLNIRTVVHCAAGASRSTTIVLAYLIKYQGLTLHDSFGYVHNARECARPNIGFFEQLVSFEKSLSPIGQPSVNIVEIITENGYKIKFPDFYKTDLPYLYLIEINKQLKMIELNSRRDNTTVNTKNDNLVINDDNNNDN